MKEAYPILSNKGNVLRHSSISGCESINDDSPTFKLFSAGNGSSAASPDKSDRKAKIVANDYNSQIDDYKPSLKPLLLKIN